MEELEIFINPEMWSQIQKNKQISEKIKSFQTVGPKKMPKRIKEKVDRIKKELGRSPDDFALEEDIVF